MGFILNFIKGLRGRTAYISGAGMRTGPRQIELETNELCSAIIDCNATHIARAQVYHVVMDKSGRISEIKRSSEYTRLFRQPNPMMTRQDFLYCMAWQLQLANLALAWVKWEGAHPAEIWPLICLDMEVRRREGGGYAVEFTDMDGTRYCVALEDLIVLRRKYNGVGYTGQGNQPVAQSLDMVMALDDGLRQAVQISNKIHGLLRQRKSMLSGDDVKAAQEDFISRMKQAAQSGGIVALDAMEDYTPLNVSAWTANASQQKQITERVYTWWRTPREVVDNTATEQVMQNYFDSVVEPVWEEMAEAFTAALFTRKEQAFGSRMIVTSGAATGASWNTKLMLVANTKDLGLLTPNEYRELLGYAPVEEGDERLVSLNYVKAGDQSRYQTGDEEKAATGAGPQEGGQNADK